MNKILLKKLGTKQNSRDDCLLFMVDNIEGLMESFDKNFQNGLILIAGKIQCTAMDFSRGLNVCDCKKIDIKSETVKLLI